MQERWEQAKSGARNAGLAVAMTLLMAILGLGDFGVRTTHPSSPRAHGPDTGTGGFGLRTHTCGTGLARRDQTT